MNTRIADRESDYQRQRIKRMLSPEVTLPFSPHAQRSDPYKDSEPVRGYKEVMKELPLDKAGRLLVQLQRSTIYKERWRKERLAAIEAVERNVKARMRQAVQNDPELLAQLQRLVSDAAAEEAGRDEG